jgi:hypothetical protein
VLNDRSFLGRALPNRNPITDGWQVAARARLVPHAPGHIGEQLVAIHVQAKSRTVGDGHATRQESLRPVRLEERLLPLGPAQFRERQSPWIVHGEPFNRLGLDCIPTGFFTGSQASWCRGRSD